jgi:hypothetical protein
MDQNIDDVAFTRAIIEQLKADACVDSGAETARCTVQGGSHCGNYQSFGIVNIAWEMFQKASFPDTRYRRVL